MALELAVLFALVLANGLFAGAEIAVISMRPAQVRARTDRRGAALLALREHPERFLATVQIGITVIGAGAAAYGGASIAADLAPALVELGLGGAADEVAFGLVIALVSWLSLVFGELVPKSLALRFSRGYAFAVARPLLLLARIFRPLVWFLTACSNVVLRPFGDRTTFSEARHSRDELRELVEDAGKTGALDPQTSRIATRALGFEDVRVGELMVARGDVVALRRGAAPEEIRRIILEDGHSRMPVHDGTLDGVVGYVVARDLMSMVWERELIVLDDLIRPAYFVDVRTRAVDVLRELQRQHLQLAFVSDEHGGLAGIVTIEDLIEELVGDIFSEGEAEDETLVREPAGTVLVDGSLLVRRVNRELGLALPTGTDRTTIAGVCMDLAQAVPEPGLRLTAEDGTVLEVVEASPRRVRRVRLHPAHAPT